MRRQVDELSKEELGKVWEACQFHWVRAGRLLFPERPKGYARAAKDIGHYAINKLVAIRLAEGSNLGLGQLHHFIDTE